jgi:hypothetical protein
MEGRFGSLKQIIEKTETWLKQTQMDGWKNSMVHEEEMVKGITQALESDGESTAHCRGFLKESEEIRGLLKRGKLEEAKEIYLGKHLRWREEILKIHHDNEQLKKLRNYTVGLAIIIASGGVASLAAGAVTAALETAGVSSWAVSSAGLVTNGITFTATSRSLNAFVDWSQNKQVFDSRKDLVDHVQSFAAESLMMGGMMGVLGEVAYFSRTRSLLPNIAQEGLPKELLKEGVLDLTQKESPQILAKLFEEEIAKMARVDRFLF